MIEMNLQPCFPVIGLIQQDVVLLARLQFILHDSTRLFGLPEQLPARLRSKSNMHILHIAFFSQFTLTKDIVNMFGNNRTLTPKSSDISA